MKAQVAEAAGVALADRIRQLRRKAGLSQEQLAFRAGVTTSVIRKLEQGQADNPQWTTIRAIARILDASLDDLATAADEPADAVKPPVGRPQKDQGKAKRKG
jgi:transcriptional regulator with XRE-family HTH domain